MPSDFGFHSGWVSDHVAWPSTIASHYPYSDDGSFAPPVDMPWLDPIGTLFFIAGCTETLKLGSTVLILGYRPPVLTAKAIASLDHLSEGHVILGVGVGWIREEFTVLGMPRCSTRSVAGRPSVSTTSLLDPVAPGGLAGRRAAMERLHARRCAPGLGPT